MWLKFPNHEFIMKQPSHTFFRRNNVSWTEKTHKYTFFFIHPSWSNVKWIFFPCCFEEAKTYLGFVDFPNKAIFQTNSSSSLCTFCAILPTTILRSWLHNVCLTLWIINWIKITLEVHWGDNRSCQTDVISFQMKCLSRSFIN